MIIIIQLDIVKNKTQIHRNAVQIFYIFLCDIKKERKLNPFSKAEIRIFTAKEKGWR